MPDWCEGEVLPKLGGKQNSDRIVFAIDAKENSSFTPIAKATFSATQWPYKLINYQGYQGFEDVSELYDLENDPEELNDLSESKPNIVLNLRQVLFNNLHAAEKNSVGEL